MVLTVKVGLIGQDSTLLYHRAPESGVFWYSHGALQVYWLRTATDQLSTPICAGSTGGSFVVKLVGGQGICGRNGPRHYVDVRCVIPSVFLKHV